MITAHTNTFVIAEDLKQAYSIKTCIIHSNYLEIVLISANELSYSFKESNNPAFELKKTSENYPKVLTYVLKIFPTWERLLYP